MAVYKTEAILYTQGQPYLIQILHQEQMQLVIQSNDLLSQDKFADVVLRTIEEDVYYAKVMIQSVGEKETVLLVITLHKERREYPRVQLHTEGRVKLIENEKSLKVLNKFMIKIENVGVGGIGFITQETLCIDDFLNISFYINQMHFDDVICKVERIIAIDKGYEVGSKFLALYGEKRNIISDYIESALNPVST
jgi:hypothetical protein